MTDPLDWLAQRKNWKWGVLILVVVHLIIIAEMGNRDHLLQPPLKIKGSVAESLP